MSQPDLSKLDLSHCGVRPQIAGDMASALTHLQQDGAVIVENVGPEETDARQLAYDLFGSRVLAVPPAARVFDGGEKDNKGDLDNTQTLPPHTDGFGYGDLYPDYILLDCVNSSPAGGESFLVDGYAVLEALRQSPQHAWVADALNTVIIDQTEEGMQASESPVIQHTEQGRMMLRKTIAQKPRASSTTPERDSEMVQVWKAAVNAAMQHAPLFKLAPGQAVAVDNYRLLHGRLPYTDMGRLMWRVWLWTEDSLAGPPDLPLHSDTRFAHA